MWPLVSCEDQLEVAHVQFPGYIAAWAPPHSPAPAFPPSAFPLHGADQRYSRAASGDSRAVASFSGQELSRASPSGRLSGKTKLSNLGIEAPSVLVAWPESSKGHRAEVWWPLNLSPKDWSSKERDLAFICVRYLPGILNTGLPMWLSGKEPACPCRSHGFNPGSGKSHGESNGNPLQYSCLRSP